MSIIRTTGTLVAIGYASQQDYIDRYGEEELIVLTDRSGTLGAVNPDVFATAQADGDAEIDSYLRGRYSLPLTTPPAELIRIACDLYRYYLHTPQIPDPVLARYKAAIEFLKRVALGQAQLDITGTGEAPPATTILSSSQDRLFNRQLLRNL